MPKIVEPRGTSGDRPARWSGDMSLTRRLLAVLGIERRPATPTPLPARGDAVEAWLKAQRAQFEDKYGRTPAWYTVDAVLDAYRLHADTGTPLSEHVCEGRVVGDCACLGVAA